MLVGTIAMMGSFGPVTAIASLSNNLTSVYMTGTVLCMPLIVSAPYSVIMNGFPVFCQKSNSSRMAFSAASKSSLPLYHP